MATADWTPLTVVSRSWTTAEIDTFMNDVSITNTNIAAASRMPCRGIPPGLSAGIHVFHSRDRTASGCVPTWARGPTVGPSVRPSVGIVPSAGTLIGGSGDGDVAFPSVGWNRSQCKKPASKPKLLHRILWRHSCWALGTRTAICGPLRRDPITLNAQRPRCAALRSLRAHDRSEQNCRPPRSRSCRGVCRAIAVRLVLSNDSSASSHRRSPRTNGAAPPSLPRADPDARRTRCRPPSLCSRIDDVPSTGQARRKPGSA